MITNHYNRTTIIMCTTVMIEHLILRDWYHSRMEQPPIPDRTFSQCNIMSSFKTAIHQGVAWSKKDTGRTGSRCNVAFVVVLVAPRTGWCVIVDVQVASRQRSPHHHNRADDVTLHVFP